MLPESVQLGTLGEWAAAVTGGAALIFAFLGWRETRKAAVEQARYIAAEMRHIEADATQRQLLAAQDAAKVQVRQTSTNIDGRGALSTMEKFPIVVAFNGSGHTLAALAIRVEGGSGAWQAAVPPDGRVTCRLLTTDERWWAEFVDLAGNAWTCDSDDPLPRLMSTDEPILWGDRP